VLDLGSGAGIDVFLAARKVGPSGRAIGVDMTEDMIRKADQNKTKLHAENTEFRFGEIENLPVATGTVDRIISNCVINLVPDKARAFAEMYRVLKPGGRFTVSDIVTRGEMPDAVRHDLSEWAGCVAGAIDRDDYIEVARKAGFSRVSVVSEKPYTLDPSVSFGLQSITVSGTK